jgi:phosphoribosyl-ATP pyrophosphohydrolase
MYAEILERSVERPAGSYTTSLLDGGVHAIGKKIVEEAAETWIAAEYQTNDELAEEISQLIYHVQVMMVARGVTPDDVGRYL